MAACASLSAPERRLGGVQARWRIFGHAVESDPTVLKMTRSSIR